MKPSTFGRLVLILAAAVLLGGSAGEPAAPPAKPAAEVVFEGTFHWKAIGYQGDLRAVFTPRAEGLFDVAFDFYYQGHHVYKGTARGDLEKGPLEGTVQNESWSRTFRFNGKLVDGKLEGEHQELRDGDVLETGSLSMKRK